MNPKFSDPPGRLELEVSASSVGVLRDGMGWGEADPFDQGNPGCARCAAAACVLLDVAQLAQHVCWAAQQMHRCPYETDATDQGGVTGSSFISICSTAYELSIQHHPHTHYPPLRVSNRLQLARSFTALRRAARVARGRDPPPEGRPQRGRRP